MFAGVADVDSDVVEETAQTSGVFSVVGDQAGGPIRWAGWRWIPKGRRGTGKEISACGQSGTSRRGRLFAFIASKSRRVKSREARAVADDKCLPRQLRSSPKSELLSGSAGDKSIRHQIVRTAGSHPNWVISSASLAARWRPELRTNTLGDLEAAHRLTAARWNRWNDGGALARRRDEGRWLRA